MFVGATRAIGKGEIKMVKMTNHIGTTVTELRGARDLIRQDVVDAVIARDPRGGWALFAVTSDGDLLHSDYLPSRCFSILDALSKSDRAYSWY